MKDILESKLFLTLALLSIILTVIIVPMSSFSVKTHAQDVLSITEFPLPDNLSNPHDITAGPDGNLWFTESTSLGQEIGRITPNGTITEFLTSLGAIEFITAGPDGNLWFTGNAIGDGIGRITPDGIITTFPLPPSDNVAYGITVGPDGNLWFAVSNSSGDRIGKITPSGIITEFMIPTSSAAPYGITAGSDGNLWFTEEFAGKIGRITPNGTITEFSLPSGSSPYNITHGPDGNVWFTVNTVSGNEIGRITSGGTITEFSLPNGESYGITSGPDGNVWFTELNANKIGRIIPDGIITDYPISSVSSLYGITTGPDSNLWFVEPNVGKIGKATLISMPPTPTPSPTQRTKLFLFIAGFTSKLSSVDATNGSIPADTFGQSDGIEVSLSSKFPGSKFVMFSYNGDDGTGEPTEYQCQDTLTRSISVNIARLKIQIMDLMKTYQNIDVYLIGHSYGGALALGLDADMKINRQISLNGGKVVGIITLDSPLGGVPGGPLGSYYQVASAKYKSKEVCPAATGTLVSLNELTQIFLGGPLYGSHNSLMQIVNGGVFSNQEVADAQANPTSVLTVANLDDFLYAPRMCSSLSLLPKGKFLSTQVVSDQGRLRIFGRIFVGGKSTCSSLANLEVNHKVVLTNYLVKQGINQFVDNKPITSLASPAPGFQ